VILTWSFSLTDLLEFGFESCTTFQPYWIEVEWVSKPTPADTMSITNYLASVAHDTILWGASFCQHPKKSRKRVIVDALEGWVSAGRMAIAWKIAPIFALIAIGFAHRCSPCFASHL
jgi:hypothetical protein